MNPTRRNFLRQSALIPLALTSCRSEQEDADTKIIVPFKWWHANRPLSEYQEAQPRRAILAFFTAEWDMTYHIIMDLSKKEAFYKPLEDAAALCLIYDQFKQEEFTSHEMKRLGQVALPFCIVTHPRTRKETASNPFGEGYYIDPKSGMVDRTIEIINS